MSSLFQFQRSRVSEGKRYLIKAQIQFAPSKPRKGRHWVRVRAPAESRLPIEEGCSYTHSDIEISFERGSDGLLCSVIASCGTDGELVPTMLPKATTGRDWSFTEPPDENRTKLIDALCRLEGFLAPLGLVAFDFRKLEWSWLGECESGERELLVSTVLDFELNKIRRNVLTQTELQELARMALHGDSRALLTLSLFRAGEDDFQNYRYQESLRFFLLAMEHEFAAGKFKGADVARNYRREKRLIEAIELAARNASYFVKAGDIRQESVDSILAEKTPDEVIDWLVSLRGYLFHQSSKRQATWHPSIHIPHKEEAILVRSILETVIMGLVRSAG